jgi:uncharacterized protein
MAKIPEVVKTVWNDRQGPAVLATVNTDGTPNIIYVTCVNLHGDDTVVVADNYFDKTRKNIQAGSQGSLLFMAPEGKAFQLKGGITYHTEGDIFDTMKSWNPQEHPGHAAAALTVQEVYSGAEKLL